MLAYGVSHNADRNFQSRSTPSHFNFGMSPWECSLLKILYRFDESPHSLNVHVDHEMNDASPGEAHF